MNDFEAEYIEAESECLHTIYWHMEHKGFADGTIRDMFKCKKCGQEFEFSNKELLRYKKVFSALWKGLDTIVAQTGNANSIEHEMEWIRYKAIPNLLEKLAELEEGAE